MKTLTLDKFNKGLDVRKGAASSSADSLRVLTNAYITRGGAIRKRAGMVSYGTLTAGTKGLISAQGKLNTFYKYQAGAIVHGPAIFTAKKLVETGVLPYAAGTLSKVHFGFVFNGYVYVGVEFSDGVTRHYWIDIVYSSVVTMTIAAPGVVTYAGADTLVLNDPIVFTTTGALPTGLTLGTTYFVRNLNTAANTFEVSLTSGGASITTSGSQSGVHTVARVDANSIPSRAAGSGCPNSKMAVKAEARIYCIDPANDEVNFTYQGSAIDWNTIAAASTDAGSIPFGRNSPGAETPTSLSSYNGRLVVFGVDNTQLYLISADASLIALDKAVGGLGCTAAKTPANFASDLIFLAKAGFRSVSAQAVSENLQDTDVGSPIDTLVRGLALTDPKAVYFPEQNQYWCMSSGISDTTAWVYTYSRSAKIAAWSKYILPFVVDDATNHDGDLYVRSGDSVLTMDSTDSVFADVAGTQYDMVAETPFLHLQSPGKEKSIYSMDMVVQGSVNVQFRYDPNDPTKLTDAILVTGDTRPLQTVPIEITTTAIAVVITSSTTALVQIDAISFNFDVLSVN
jgi:hypothetical protein